MLQLAVFVQLVLESWLACLVRKCEASQCFFCIKQEKKSVFATGYVYFASRPAPRMIFNTCTDAVCDSLTF